MENTNEGSKDTIEQETATTNENKMTENSPKSEIVENDAEQTVTDKAASGTKSRIRSRWYRANERPLESQSTPVANPTGEITLTEGAVLKDDLSNAKPPTGGGGREERGRDGDRRGGRDGDRPGGRDGNGQRRNEDRNPESGAGREGPRDRNSSGRDEQEKPDGERNRSRRRSGNRSRNPNRSDKEGQRRDGGQASGKHRKDSRDSKSNESTSPTRKKTDAPTKKKSGGVGKFLASLFGGK